MADETLIFKIDIQGTDQQTKELGQLEAELDRVKRSMKELQKVEKDQGALTEKQSQERAKLKVQLEGTRNAFNDLKGTVLQQNDALRKNSGFVNGIKRAIKELSEEQVILTNKLRDAEKQWGKNSTQYKQVNQQLNQVNQSLTVTKNKLDVTNNTVNNYGMSLKSVRKGIAQFATSMIGVSVAIMAVQRVLSSATKTIIDFQQNNARLASVLGKTRSEITVLTEDAKRLGASTAFTATQVSQLQTEFAKLGFSTSEILNATEATLALAAATQTDLAEAASVAGATVRGFGLNASETQRVVDVMAKSFSSSALDMSKFSTAMAQVAPVAKNAGISIEETTAMLGKLTDAGVDASTAGSALRNILLENAKAGRTLEEGFNEILKSTNKNATAMELYGTRGATVATILAELQTETDDLTKALENAGGAAEKMANEQLDTLSGSLTKLSSAWEGFILSLEDGDSLLGNFFKGAIDGLTTFTTGLSNANLKDFLLLLSPTTFNEGVKSILGLGSAQNELNEAVREAKIDTQEYIRTVSKRAEADGKTDLFIASNLYLMGQNKEALLENTDLTEKQIAVIKAQVNEYYAAAEALSEVNNETVIANEEVEDLATGVSNLKDELKEPLKLEFYIETEDGLTMSEAFKFELENLSRDIGFIAEDLMDEFSEPVDNSIYDLIEKNKQAADEIEAEWQDAYNTIGLAATDAFGSVIAAQYDLQVDRAKRAAEIETQVLKDKLDKGVINETEYSQEIEELQRGVREKEKQAAIAQAVIDGASAALKAIAMAGPPPISPAGIAGIAGAAITTAAKIAVIESQTFADGGVFEGASHDKGGIKGTLNGRRIEVEGDEMWIANKRAKRSNKIHTAQGTPEEIISGLNGLYGGRNWKQGAKISDAMQVDYTQGGSTIQQIIQAELSDERIVRELSRQRKENNRNSRELKQTLKLKANGYY